MNQAVLRILALAPTFALGFACTATAQTPTPTSVTGKVPPTTWVDKDTGHRVWRLSNEPNSGAFYFNVNGYTPDLKTMIYTAPDGIHTLDMATKKTKLLVPNP